jgi:tetratricopeptide (TPR) repeat protein
MNLLAGKHSYKTVFPGQILALQWPFVCLLLFFSVALFAHPGVEDRIHLLSEDIQAAPQSQYLYIQRGLAYSNNNQPEKALVDIIAAENFGEPIEAAFAHGILLYRGENFRVAREYFDSYLHAYPNHLATLGYRARLLRDAGEHAAALADFQTIFELNPMPDPGLYISAAQMMVALPDYGIEGALTLLDERMKQVGMISPLQRFAIALEVDRQNYKGAIIRQDKLDVALHSSAQWQVEMAQLQLMAGHKAQAGLYLDKANALLATLRPTGARVELKQQALELLHAIASESDLETSLR